MALTMSMSSSRVVMPPALGTMACRRLPTHEPTCGFRRSSVRARLATDQLARHFTTAMLCFCFATFSPIMRIPCGKFAQWAPWERESKPPELSMGSGLVFASGTESQRAFLMWKGKLVLLFLLLLYTLLAGMSSIDFIRQRTLFFLRVPIARSL